MKELKNDPSLCFTEEEAMGLLDIVMLSPCELTPEQRTAILKLSDFCRELMREAAGASVLAPPAHSSLPATFAA